MESPPSIPRNLPLAILIAANFIPVIVVLHIAIIIGAFVITALDRPVYLLLILIAGKILLDAKLHLRSHRKLNPEWIP